MSSRLMQRKFSEPNTYIDGLPSQDRPELLYDDVEMSELTATVRTRGGPRGEGGAVQSSCRQTSIPLAIGGVDSKSPAGPLGQKSRRNQAVFCPGVGSRPGMGTGVVDHPGQC